jgi:zinc-binding in reverse transcriptase
MSLHNKMLTKDNLCKRRWIGDSSCVFCSARETVDLFFNCPFMFDFWVMIFTGRLQRRSLNINSLLEVWNSCLLLHNCQCVGFMVGTQ